MATRQSVVTEAETWLRTRYHHCARVKGVGVDCAQLLIAVYGGLGMLAADAVHQLEQLHYSPQWHLHQSEELYLQWLARFAREVNVGDAGDVAIWRFGRTFSHAGILANRDTVIHALRDSRYVTITGLDESPLAGRPVKFYTLFEA